MLFLYFKSLHIIFVVSWFAGLFYIVRLFIYHTEALDREEPSRSILHKEYSRNERLLWQVITVPAMVLTVATGILMIVKMPILFKQTWLHVKLGLVLGLLAYHFYCGSIMRKLWEERKVWSSFKLRLWNEVATIFLVSIVFIVVLKHMINWFWATLGFLAFGIFIMIVVKLVKRFRDSGKAS